MDMRDNRIRAVVIWISLVAAVFAAGPAAAGPDDVYATKLAQAGRRAEVDQKVG